MAEVVYVADMFGGFIQAEVVGRHKELNIVDTGSDTQLELIPDDALYSEEEADTLLKIEAECLDNVKMLNEIFSLGLKPDKLVRLGLINTEKLKEIYNNEENFYL